MSQILAWAGYAGGIGMLVMALWGGIRAEELFDAEHVPTWGGTDVFALDPRTYNASARKDVVAYMKSRAADHRQRAFGYGVTYVPGLYLEYAVDERLMKHVAETYGRCWFFGRTSRNQYDDQPHFGRPDWKWFLKLQNASSGAR